MNDSLADDILNIQKIIELLLHSQCRCQSLLLQKWFRGLVVRLERRDGHQFALGVAQSGQFPAENTTCIYVDSAVQPLRLANRSMPIDHHRFTSILRGPVVTNWQTIFVGFARRFPVECEITDLARATSLHFFFHAGVSDDELSIIENIMTYQIVEELN